MAALEGMLPNGQGPKRGDSQSPPRESEADCQHGRLSTLTPGTNQIPPCEEDATWGVEGVADHRAVAGTGWHSQAGHKCSGEPGTGIAT